MKRLTIIIVALLVAVIGIALLKSSSAVSDILWSASAGGSWLLPLVAISALLDSVHPCSFSILLITIAFLFGLAFERKRILQVGGLYIAGIFAAYLGIGIGLLSVLHIFSVPHFMGKLGALLLIGFGLLNVLGALFPRFPVRLKIPDSAHGQMSRFIKAASLPAAFGLGLLVGLCQFPCMGGPYLMVIGLLHDTGTYAKGFSYLFLYNLILIVPLVATLWVAAEPTLLGKVEEWKKEHMRNTHFWAGIAMLIIGSIILLTA